MNISLVLGIGAVVGALEGVTIFFAPEEPYKLEIFLAATLKGLFVSLLTGLSLTTQSLWWQGLSYGLLYGLALALIVFLAKGGFGNAHDVPYVLLGGVVAGVFIGLLVAGFGFS